MVRIVVLVGVQMQSPVERQGETQAVNPSGEQVEESSDMSPAAVGLPVKDPCAPELIPSNQDRVGLPVFAFPAHL
jgi:hypothetical protein